MRIRGPLLPALFLVLVLPALILLPGSGQAWAGETKAQAATRQADFYKARGANKEAYPFYLQAVRLAPGDYLTHRALADNLASQKRFREAMVEVNLAIGLHPGEGKMYVERGLYFVGLGNKASAQADFERAVVMPHCGHTVYKFLEDMYQEQGKIDKAIAMSDLHIKVEATDDTYSDKAKLLALKKDYAGARQALTSAIAKAPFNYRCYELRGDAYLASSLAKEAVADYTKALSLDPYFPAEIYQNRARAYAQLGQKELEQKDIQSSKIKD